MFWPQRIAAGFSILSSLCDSSPSYCSSLCTLPPRQSQLPSTLSNTPVYYTNIQTQAHTHKPSHVHRPMSMHAYTVSMHTRPDAYTHTKDILSHFCGMSEGFKKQGCFVITSASAVESVRAGWAGGGPGNQSKLLVRQTTPCLVSACTKGVHK